MKKIFSLIAVLTISLVVFGQSTTSASKVNYPMGKASVYVPALDSGDIAVTLTNNVTVINMCPAIAAADTLKGNLVIKLTIPTVETSAGTKYDIPIGSLVYIIYQSGHNVKTITLSTGCTPTASAINSVTHKVGMITLLFDGVTFKYQSLTQVN